MAFRWGIMGAGSIAGKFIDAINRTESAEIVAVGSRDTARAEAFAQRHGVPAAYGSYEAMLSAGGLDAVYIATRTDSHAALTRLCIAHGVPVLCEKAMFISSAEATLVIAPMATTYSGFSLLWARARRHRSSAASEITGVCSSGR